MSGESRNFGCPCCGLDVRTCSCARSITTTETTETLTPTQGAVMQRWVQSVEPAAPMNRAQRRAAA